MNWFILLATLTAVVAELYGSQYSGYEVTEKVKRAQIIPMSSYRGDQQGYNGDSITPLVRVPNPQTVTLRLGAASWSPHGIGRVGAAVELPETPDEESSSSAEDETEDSSQPSDSAPPLRPVQPPPATLDVVTEQYPLDTNDIQSEIGQSSRPQMNAIDGEALAYSNDLHLRVRRF